MGFGSSFGKKGAWKEGGEDGGWRKDPGSGGRSRSSETGVDKCHGMPRDLGQWHLRWVTLKQQHSGNQHNFILNLPGPALTSLWDSGDSGNIVLGQDSETTKQGRSSNLVGSSINPSVQIQHEVFTCLACDST